MGFDETKAQFNDEELDMAEHADAIYETVAEAVADGFDLSDLTVIPAAIPHVLALYGYLADGTKADYAKKLIALGVCLLRDNEWIDDTDD